MDDKYPNILLPDLQEESSPPKTTKPVLPSLSFTIGTNSQNATDELHIPLPDASILSISPNITEELSPGGGSIMSSIGGRKNSQNSLDGESLGDLTFDEPRTDSAATKGSFKSNVSPIDQILVMNDKKDIIFKSELSMYEPQYFKSWKKRFAVLYKTELLIYVDSKNHVTKQVIPLSRIKEVNWVNSSGFNAEKNQFHLISKKHEIEFLFSHNELEKATKWVNHIMVQVMQCAKISIVEEISVIKKGIIKMDKVRHKRFFALLPNCLAYYDTEREFLEDFPIYRIHVSQLAVKQESNSRIIIPTNCRRFVLCFNNDAERDEWFRAMQQAYENFYVIQDFRIQERIYTVPTNRRCADCGEEDPQWANVSLYVTLCNKCIGVHRSFPAFVGKSLSIQLDTGRWSENAINLMIKIGNDVSNEFWLGGGGDCAPITPNVSSEERLKYIREKYEDKKFAKIALGTLESLGKQMELAINSDNIALLAALYFSGAEFSSCNAYEIAMMHGNLDILEFITSHSGLTVAERFATRIAAFIHECEVWAVSFMADGILRRRKCTLSRGVLHIVLDGDQEPEPERIYTFSQFLFVSHLSKDGCVRMNIDSSDTKIILFRCCDDNKDPVRLQKWALHLSQCFIPHPQWESVDQLLCTSSMYVCYTSFGDWCESWCLLLDNELQVVSSIGNKVNTFRIRSASNIKLESSQVLNVKPNMHIPPQVSDLMVAIQFPELIIYLSSKWELVLHKWYAILKDIIFGSHVSIRNSLEFHVLGKDQIPLIVEKCVRYLSMHIFEEGIYRKSGGKSRVEALCSALVQKPKEIDWKDSTWTVHDVTGALKKFFRELDDPPLTQHLKQQWLDTAMLTNEEEKIIQYKALLKQLPLVNYNTIRFLIIHLVNVAHQAKENLMNVENLSMIFSQCLLTSAGAADLGPQNDFSNIPSFVVRDLIVHYETLFQVTKEEKRREERLIDALKGVAALDSSSKSDSSAEPASLMVPITLKTFFAKSTHSSASAVVQSEHPSINVPVTEETTADSLVQYLAEKDRLTSTNGLLVFDCLLGGELQRPLVGNERIKELFYRSPDIVKVSVIEIKADDNSILLDNLPPCPRQPRWEIQFSERKNDFKKRHMTLTAGEVVIAKNPNYTDTVFHYHTTFLTLYYGAEKKRKPPSPHCLSAFVHHQVQNTLSVDQAVVLSFSTQEDKLTFWAACSSTSPIPLPRLPRKNFSSLPPIPPTAPVVERQSMLRNPMRALDSLFHSNPKLV